VLGFLYPGLGVAEDDLTFLVEQLCSDGSVRAEIVETPIDEDAHTVEALLDLGQQWRLHAGAEVLREGAAAVVIWACTSGSFVFGWQGAQRQVSELGRFAGVPSSSTSLAFVAALGVLGITRVSIAASYPEPVTSRFVKLLNDAGIEVLGAISNDIMTAADSGVVDAATLEALVLAGDHPDAQATLVPDTALHTVRSIAALEAALEKPVLTANQVSVWQALRLAGVRPAGEHAGRLFAAG
jgi:maleate cis-trans isomerase